MNAQNINSLRQLGEAALELVWPTRCVGCEKHGVLLCASCAADLAHIDRALACPRCGAPYGAGQCTECWGREGPQPLSFTAAVSALEFPGLAARLITIYKDGGERRLAPILASLLLGALPQNWIAWASAFCAIPADAQARKRREFDHMELIGGQFARLTGLPQLAPLLKLEGRDQRGMGRYARQDNASELFALKAEYRADDHGVDSGRTMAASSGLPRRVLLIDDVMTTGATLGSAADVLLAAGVLEVRVATIARVW